MGKFDFKGILKSGMETGKAVLPITAGIIASQKFLDAKTFFPNVSPDEWYIKHEGGIKFGAGAITLAMWKKCPPMLKYLIWGIMIQGAIKEVRSLTMGKEGKAFFESIGNEDYDSQINEMANSIKKAAGVGMNGITDNNYSSVSGLFGNLDINPSVSLMNNSATGVSGIGMDFEPMYTN